MVCGVWQAITVRGSAQKSSSTQMQKSLDRFHSIHCVNVQYQLRRVVCIYMSQYVCGSIHRFTHPFLLFSGLRDPEEEEGEKSRNWNRLHPYRTWHSACIIANCNLLEAIHPSSACSPTYYVHASAVAVGILH